MKRKDLKVGMIIEFNGNQTAEVVGMYGVPISLRFGDTPKTAMIVHAMNDDLSVKLGNSSMSSRGITNIVGVYENYAAYAHCLENQGVDIAPANQRPQKDLDLKNGTEVIFRNGLFGYVSTIGSNLCVNSVNSERPMKLTPYRFDSDGRLVDTSCCVESMKSNPSSFDIVLISNGVRFVPTGCCGSGNFRFHSSSDGFAGIRASLGSIVRFQNGLVGSVMLNESRLRVIRVSEKNIDIPTYRYLHNGMINIDESFEGIGIGDIPDWDIETMWDEDGNVTISNPNRAKIKEQKMFEAIEDFVAGMREFYGFSRITLHESMDSVFYEINEVIKLGSVKISADGTFVSPILTSCQNLEEIKKLVRDTVKEITEGFEKEEAKRSSSNPNNTKPKDGDLCLFWDEDERGRHVSVGWFDRCTSNSLDHIQYYKVGSNYPFWFCKRLNGIQDIIDTLRTK